VVKSFNIKFEFQLGGQMEVLRKFVYGVQLRVICFLALILVTKAILTLTMCKLSLQLFITVCTVTLPIVAIRITVKA